MHTTRRKFLAAAAASTALPYFPWSQSAFANETANDRPLLGCIGVGSMGKADAREHAHFADIVAVCDVDSRHADEAREHDAIGKGVADAYDDYRKVLDRSDIDVVSIVTPDHWHVKIAIDALEAGKHVFCQKPLTLTLEENQLIRNACEKHPDKVFVVGTQQRSDKNRFLRAVNMVQKGLLGDIQRITVGIDGGDVGGLSKSSRPPRIGLESVVGSGTAATLSRNGATTNFAGGTNTLGASSRIGVRTTLTLRLGLLTRMVTDRDLAKLMDAMRHIPCLSLTDIPAATIATTRHMILP